MKRKSYKGVKYGAIIVAGMLLMALPMTAMAEKNAEATVVEATTEAEETTAEKKTEETTAAKEETTKAEETTEAAEETTAAKEETKAEETTKAAEETTAAEEETKAEEKSTEDAEETTAAKEETTTESKTTETETTAAETTAAEVKSEAKLDSAIIGTWSVDERTSLNFGESSKGKLILPDEDYAFSYKIEGDQLSLDFVSSKATDGTYTASVSGDTLKLIGGKGTIGGTFELSKNK